MSDVARALVPLCGELVCSNSLRSDDPVAPAGLLKHELRRCGSLVIDCADHHRVLAGQALAVKRFGFARAITRRLALHPRIRIERRRFDELSDGPRRSCASAAHRGRARRRSGPSSAAIGCTSTTRRAGRGSGLDRLGPAFRGSEWGRDTIAAGPSSRRAGDRDGDRAAGGEMADLSWALRRPCSARSGVPSNHARELAIVLRPLGYPAVERHGFDFFLSHNSVDKPRVTELHDALRDRGASAFLDATSIELGRDWAAELECALATCRCFVFALAPGRPLTPHLRHEVNVAVDRARTSSDVRIITIWLAATAPAAVHWPAGLSSYQGLCWHGGLTADEVAARLIEACCWTVIEGPPAGVVRCIAADPFCPGRLLAGDHHGGVMRSDDCGRELRPSGLDAESISALAFSPVRRGLVWAVGDRGAFLSEDGGATWQHRIADKECNAVAFLPTGERLLGDGKPSSGIVGLVGRGHGR